MEKNKTFSERFDDKFNDGCLDECIRIIYPSECGSNCPRYTNLRNELKQFFLQELQDIIGEIENNIEKYYPILEKEELTKDFVFHLINQVNEDSIQIIKKRL